MFQETLSPALRDDWGLSSVSRLPPSHHHKIIVVSDLHFPRSDSHPKYLYEFLLHHTCDTLILLGDTHEGYDPELADFRELNLRVWDLIAARKAQGMKVIDLPGNHDSYKRRDSILAHKAFDTEYWDDLVVQSALGPTYLFHGDALDGHMTRRYDKVAYKVAAKVAIGNHSMLDVYSGLEKMSDYLFGGKGKKTNCANVELAAASRATENDCNAVLMGHTHKPSDFKPVQGKAEILYGNTGAWVGGLTTAMVQNHDGQWEMINWSQERRGLYGKKPLGIGAPHLYAAFRDATLAEFSWQKAQHSLFAQEALVHQTRQALDNVEKIKKRVKEYLKTAEEKLMKTSEEVERINLSANIEPLRKPSVNHPVFDVA